MDRLNRGIAGCSLMLLLAWGAGCRSTRPEVPPGRPYAGDGRQAPPINFSNDPHPMNGPGMAGGMGAMSGAPEFGTPNPAASANAGAPTSNYYGPPGTSTGMGQMPAGPGYSAPGMEAGSMPATGLGAPSVGESPSPSTMPGTAP